MNEILILGAYLLLGVVYLLRTQARRRRIELERRALLLRRRTEQLRIGELREGLEGQVVESRDQLPV